MGLQKHNFAARGQYRILFRSLQFENHWIFLTSSYKYREVLLKFFFTLMNLLLFSSIFSQTKFDDQTIFWDLMRFWLIYSLIKTVKKIFLNSLLLALEVEAQQFILWSIVEIWILRMNSNQLEVETMVGHWLLVLSIIVRLVRAL